MQSVRVEHQLEPLNKQSTVRQQIYNQSKGWTTDLQPINSQTMDLQPINSQITDLQPVNS